MQDNPGYLPIFRTTRNGFVDSIAFGAVAVLTPQGTLFAHYGNPELTAFLRSSAKPFQAIPLVEEGGIIRFQITSQELALICSSHAGTDHHLKTLHSLQQKIGIQESDLQCGIHPPFHKPSQVSLRDRGQTPSPNHHNCSGKHTGMLGLAKCFGADLDPYLDPKHPVQRHIVSLMREICSLEDHQIQVGVDGCSAPTFAMPLKHAAWGWARMMDPTSLSPDRAQACQAIVSAMTSHPFEIAGPGRLDSQLMEAGDGKIAAKGGAEGYQALGVRKHSIGEHSPALGIALKVAHGDPEKTIMKWVILETLRQLRVFSHQQINQLSPSGTGYPITNQQGKQVGEGHPCFELTFSEPDE